MKSLKLAMVVIGSGVAGAALAQAPAAPAPGSPPPNFPPAFMAARAAAVEACKGDVQKFCADKQGAETRTCIEAKLGEVSKGCSDAFKKMQQEARAANLGPPPK